MRVLGVIPARLHSTRLPEKLIRKINDKYILQYVWENVSKASKVDEVVIATDHEKIMKIASDFGANVVMTRATHKSGTDRVFEVAQSRDFSVVVNVQGDEPLMPSESIDRLLSVFEDSANNVKMATLCCKSTDKETYNDYNVVKVVRDKNDNALYFSRSPIPFYRDLNSFEHFKHIGIYAYSKDFLMSIPTLKNVYLEDAEKLEQLRVLENGIDIKVVEVGHDSIGVDTEQDLLQVERLINGSGK